MKLTPVFKKIKKESSRPARLPSYTTVAISKKITILSEFSNFSKTKIVEELIKVAFEDFLFSLECKAPAMIGKKSIKPLKNNKMESKNQTHLLNPDGTQPRKDLVFTNLFTYNKSYFANLETATAEIFEAKVSGYLYSELTREQHFFANGVLTNKKQF